MTEEEKFGLTIAVIAGSTLLVILLSFLITWLLDKYNKRPRIIEVYDGRFVIVRRNYGSIQAYDVSNNDWWYDFSLATKFSNKDAAKAHLPHPISFIEKRKRKIAEQKVLREREERLKAHKEKMLKVRLDFSDYG